MDCTFKHWQNGERSCANLIFSFAALAALVLKSPPCWADGYDYYAGFECTPNKAYVQFGGAYNGGEDNVVASEKWNVYELTAKAGHGGTAETIERKCVEDRKEYVFRITAQGCGVRADLTGAHCGGGSGGSDPAALVL
jgi:hypothetical protein